MYVHLQNALDSNSDGGSGLAKATSLLSPLLSEHQRGAMPLCARVLVPWDLHSKIFGHEATCLLVELVE